MNLRMPSLGLAFLSLQAIAQHSALPIIPVPPPDEYVDVTGDGRADLLITSRTVHITDPQQPGYLGMYKLGVRTLSGTSILLWSTPSTQRWYTVEDSTRPDTGLLAKRIHFKQLSWSDPDHPTEFWLLERPFGPAISKDQDGWYGTGEHYDGSLVMRSANERGTSLATFAFELPFPYGRLAIKVKDVVPVPNGFGDEGDPVPVKPKVVDEFDFGHEANEPQVMVPPGIPPDEPLDLTSDDIPDVVITGENAPYHATAPLLGTYHRGVRLLPGSALLMVQSEDGGFAPFVLHEEQALTPDQLATGLSTDRFRWAEPPRWREFMEVLSQRYGTLRTPDEPPGWLPAEEPWQGARVFRSTQYGRPMIGCFEVIYTTPGGELGVRPGGLVEEGEVLEVR